MKQLNYVLTTLAGMALLTFSACEPQNKPKEWKTFGPFYLDSLADYVCFEVGTTWVYKNPLSGNRDTVRVMNAYRDTATIIDKDYYQKIIRETFYTGFTFSLGGGFSGSFRDFNYIWAGRGDLAYKHKIDFGKSKQGGPAGTIVALFYPFDKKYNPTEIYPGFEFTILESKDTTVTVYGRTFNRVQVFKDTRDYTWGNWPAIYYWAAGYGIVYRKNLQTGEEWYLESEDILQ
jgi:hypothetical protein